MLPYNATAVVEATLIQVYGPERAKHLNPMAAYFAEPGEPVAARAIQGARRLAARVFAFAL